MGSVVILVAMTKASALIVLSLAAANVDAAASVPLANTDSSWNASNVVSTLAPVSRTIPASQARDIQAVTRQELDSSDEKESRLTLNLGLAKLGLDQPNAQAAGSGSTGPSVGLATPVATANLRSASSSATPMILPRRLSAPLVQLPWLPNLVKGAS